MPVIRLNTKFIHAPYNYSYHLKIISDFVKYFVLKKLLFLEQFFVISGDIVNSF